MANQYLSVLKNLEKVAAEKRTTFELPAGFSFASGVRRYGVRSGIKPRKEYWSYEQEQTFTEVCLNGAPGKLEPNEMIYRGFMLMAYLGQRLTDVIEMTVDQFDGTHVALKQSKTSQEVNIKVHEDILPILQKAKLEANKAGVLKSPNYPHGRLEALHPGPLFETMG